MVRCAEARNGSASGWGTGLNMAGIERIPVHIPGVEVVGEFPIKRFLETIYNAAAKQYGVKLKLTIMPPDEHWRAAERSGPACEGTRERA